MRVFLSVAALLFQGCVLDFIGSETDSYPSPHGERPDAALFKMMYQSGGLASCAFGDAGQETFARTSRNHGAVTWSFPLTEPVDSGMADLAVRPVAGYDPAERVVMQLSYVTGEVPGTVVDVIYQVMEWDDDRRPTLIARWASSGDSGEVPPWWVDCGGSAVALVPDASDDVAAACAALTLDCTP